MRRFSAESKRCSNGICASSANAAALMMCRRFIVRENVSIPVEKIPKNPRMQYTCPGYLSDFPAHKAPWTASGFAGNPVRSTHPAKGEISAAAKMKNATARSRRLML